MPATQGEQLCLSVICINLKVPHIRSELRPLWWPREDWHITLNRLVTPSVRRWLHTLIVALKDWKWIIIKTCLACIAADEGFQHFAQAVVTVPTQEGSVVTSECLFVHPLPLLIQFLNCVSTNQCKGESQTYIIFLRSVHQKQAVLNSQLWGKAVSSIPSGFASVCHNF